MGGKRFAGVKLVVTDLDGTFLSSGKTISPKNLAAVKGLRQAGIRFSIATGRAHQMTQAYAEALGIDTPLICSNGTILYDWSRRETVAAVTLARDAARELLERCARIGADFVAYTPHRVWFPQGSGRIAVFEQYNRLAKEQGHRPMDFAYLGGSFAPVLEEGLLKILVIERSGNDLAQIGEAAVRLPGLLLDNPEAGALEINAAAAGKGNGVAALCRHLGILPEETCVFGDWQNDLSMFRIAGYSVAMKNAMKEVRAAATAITCSNDRDGFAAAVARYILTANEYSQRT